VSEKKGGENDKQTRGRGELKSDAKFRSPRADCDIRHIENLILITAH